MGFRVVYFHLDLSVKRSLVVNSQLPAMGAGMMRKFQLKGGRCCCFGCGFLSCTGRKWSALRVSCAWPVRSCSASSMGVAKTLNWCDIFWRVMLSLHLPMSFVSSIMKLGRLGEVKFWTRLSCKSWLVAGMDGVCAATSHVYPAELKREFTLRKILSANLSCSSARCCRSPPHPLQHSGNLHRPWRVTSST